MEKDLAHMLQQHAIDADLHPDVQLRLQEHLHQTQYDAEPLEACIERLGGSTSATKSALGTAMGSLGSALTTTAKDKLVKNMLMDYAAEHFEIAAYTSLITAAEEVGDPDTAEVCRRILQEEQEIAEMVRAEGAGRDAGAPRPVGADVTGAAARARDRRVQLLERTSLGSRFRCVSLRRG